MQTVNGIDHTHSSAQTPPPATENSGDTVELPEDLKKKLKELLPREAVSPNPQKPGLSVIKVIYIVERLNDVFGLNGWQVCNEIVETGKMVVVRATCRSHDTVSPSSSSVEMTTLTAAMRTRVPAPTRSRNAPAISGSAWTYTRGSMERRREIAAPARRTARGRRHQHGRQTQHPHKTVRSGTASA